jgi:hypothetical protein
MQQPTSDSIVDTTRFKKVSLLTEILKSQCPRT